MATLTDATKSVLTERVTTVLPEGHVEPSSLPSMRSYLVELVVKSAIRHPFIPCRI